MKVSSLDNNSVHTHAVQLAQLSGPHGYRMNGDTVHLNAMFALLDSAADDRSWALQLWACQSAPASTRDLAGHMVAEVSLPPMSELADETEHFEVSALAWPPAGVGEHVMVLVLASGRIGQFDDVHDIAVYPRPQEFIQPLMSGAAGYRLDGSRVKITVDRIENPRPETNQSGTLSLELWALSAPFAGGRFQGHHLAGVEIGTVSGQCEPVPQPSDLAFNPPPAGNWQIVLMLREWTDAGFVTRDFANFATRFVVAAPVAQTAPAPAVEKTSVAAAAKPAVFLVEKPAAPVASVAIAPVAPVAIAPVAPKAIAPVNVKASAPAVARAAVPAAPVRAAANASAKIVSVNTARAEELAAVKGLTAKLAEGIVKKRPFSSLDDLRKVKGLGASILAKVRSSLKL